MARSNAAPLLCLTLACLLGAIAAEAQDREYLAALERAQRARPAALSPHARIAPATEPGTPLRIHGQVIEADGTTPAANVIVFAYHTDQQGRYDNPGAPPHSWRLRGWARTDAQGRFEFSTIRPGSYPQSRTPAHVHFTLYRADGARFHAGELQFDDDPFLTESDRTRENARGGFGAIRRAEQRDGVAHVSHRIRIDPAGRF